MSVLNISKKQADELIAECVKGLKPIIDNLIDTIADRDRQIEELKAKVFALELKLYRPFPDIGEVINPHTSDCLHRGCDKNPHICMLSCPCPKCTPQC